MLSVNILDGFKDNLLVRNTRLSVIFYTIKRTLTILRSVPISKKLWNLEVFLSRKYFNFFIFGNNLYFLVRDNLAV